jgi:transposase InsO family protein
MCKLIGVHPSRFYAWLKEPLSTRAKEDQYLVGFIRQFWIESGTVYGYRKIYDDMQPAGEACGENRVYRLMRAEGQQSQRGYKRRNYYGSKPANVADNILERDFGAEKPNQTWVTDITYIRTNLTASMSRRGNCHDNAVAERIKRRIYRNRAEGKHDVFDYMELFYNPKRRHGNNGTLSPMDYEKNYFKELAGV